MNKNNVFLLSFNGVSDENNTLVRRLRQSLVKQFKRIDHVAGVMWDWDCTWACQKRLNIKLLQVHWGQENHFRILDSIEQRYSPQYDKYRNEANLKLGGISKRHSATTLYKHTHTHTLLSAGSNLKFEFTAPPRHVLQMCHHLHIHYKGSRSPPDALLPPFSPLNSPNPPENA